MNDLRKAAEMALETLCVGANDAVPNDIDERFEQAIQALRQALAHEALDEMVAENQRLGLYDDTAPPKRDNSSWVDCTDEQLMEEVRRRGFVIRDAQVGKEWVGLTTSEVIECQEASIYDTYINIEAKLKEKNT